MLRTQSMQAPCTRCTHMVTAGLQDADQPSFPAFPPLSLFLFLFGEGGCWLVEVCLTVAWAGLTFMSPCPSIEQNTMTTGCNNSPEGTSAKGQALAPGAWKYPVRQKLLSAHDIMVQALDCCRP